MIGSFITRGLVMILGYAYPAYECYKTVEKNKPEIEQLRFWCQYWILVAMMTVIERVGDTFVSWVPMYSEAKLAFIIYLWYPKTKGTTYVYDSFFKPYVSKHETEIDRNLLELRTRAGDMAFMYCQKAVMYGQTRIFEILQYLAARSTPGPLPTQAQAAQRQVPRAQQTLVTAPAAAPAAVPPRQSSTKPQPTPPGPRPQVQELLSPTSSTSSSQQEDDIEDEQSSTQSSSSTAPPSPAPVTLRKAISLPDAPNSPRRPATNKAESVQVSTLPPKTEKPAVKSPPPEDTVMEDAIRVTRGRLRKTRSTAAK